jgi:hypothetical protein
VCKALASPGDGSDKMKSFSDGGGCPEKAESLPHPLISRLTQPEDADDQLKDEAKYPETLEIALDDEFFSVVSKEKGIGGNAERGLSRMLKVRRRKTVRTWRGRPNDVKFLMPRWLSVGISISLRRNRFQFKYSSGATAITISDLKFVT